MSTPTIFVLSTQNLPQALVEFAAARGVELDVVPFIRTELLQVAERPTGPLVAVFTSQHAVEAVTGRSSEAGDDEHAVEAVTGRASEAADDEHAVEAVDARPDWKIFCIDGTTRKLVERRFGKGVIAGTAFSAGELAEVIIGSGVEKRVIFFCGDNRLDELPFRLRSAGFMVDERIVYQTVQTPQRLARDYAGVAFFSPSGADSFFSVNPVSEKAVYFAIGRTTAATVTERTGKVPVISSRPEKEVLIKEMIAHFTL